MTLLLRKDDDRVAVLTLNSPGNLNALSDAMLDALAAALKAIADDAQVRVVILRAEGRAFCAGHDLREMQTAREASDAGTACFTDLFARCSALMLTITSLPQPVIAEVQGLATAAGCQLVATCDLAVASQDARFGVNGVDVGLFCTTPMVALTRVVPAKIAFEMLTTGQFISAARAAEIGLVNRVVPPERLGSETAKLARTIAAKLNPALRLGKRAFYAQSDLSLADAYRAASEIMVENVLRADTAEGIAAFLEKRTANWSD